MANFSFQMLAWNPLGIPMHPLVVIDNGYSNYLGVPCPIIAGALTGNEFQRIHNAKSWY